MDPLKKRERIEKKNDNDNDIGIESSIFLMNIGSRKRVQNCEYVAADFGVTGRIVYIGRMVYKKLKAIYIYYIM